MNKSQQLPAKSKRTKSINLERMRKTSQRSFAHRNFTMKPLALGVATATLMSCGGSREAVVYKDANDCINQNPSQEQACEVAYQEAIKKAENSGPKYRTVNDCQADFGANNCISHRGGGGWFMPAMGGYLMARALGGRGYYDSAPFYTSYSRHSPAYGRWVGVDGSVYGSRKYGRMTVGNRPFKPQPVVKRTISRGGFGSSVSAKSNWGGSSRRSGGGWGG